MGGVWRCDARHRYGIVGTKDGHLQLFDLSSSDMVEDHEAHEVSRRRTTHAAGWLYSTDST